MKTISENTSKNLFSAKHELDCHSKILVIVSGSFPDDMNSNVILRQYLTIGLTQCLGETSVLNLPIGLLPAAIRLHKPLLVVCFGSCPPETTNYFPIRKACDDVGAHLAFWLHDDPYEFDLNYNAVEAADTLFTNDRWASIHYDHPRVYHLPLAASAVDHHRDWNQSKQSDVFFCGVAFENRIALLRDLATILTKYNTLIFGEGWPSWVPGANNRRISNKELTNRSATSLTTLYMGRNFNYANRRYQLDPSTPGPRLFEAAMTGTVQLVFMDTLEVLDYFSVGEGILLYDDPASFQNHLARLYDEPEFAKTVALNGQIRAQNDHTYTRRAVKLLKVCGINTFNE